MKLLDIFKLVAWEVVNPLLLHAKKQRRYVFNGSYIGINLGCGMDNPSKWLGIDGGVYVLLQKVPVPILKLVSRFTETQKKYSVEEYIQKIRGGDFLHHELDYGIPFDDNCIPAIFSSHFFEHITQMDANRLLRECFRVLKPGGTIRVVVPSLDEEVARIRQAVRQYEAGDVSAIQAFVTSNGVGYTNKYDNHRWMYNFAEMREALRRAGFVQITEVRFRQGRIPEVEKLDTRGGIFVEASKPEA